MTKYERKVLKMWMAYKMEKAHMMGKVYLTPQGLDLIIKAKEGK